MTDDVALAGHSLQGLDRRTGAARMLVSAQNRGTEKLPRVHLEVSINGTRPMVEFQDVEVGQTVKGEFPVSMVALQEGNSVKVDSTVRLAGQQDARPSNDTRTVIFRLKGHTGE